MRLALALFASLALLCTGLFRAEPCAAKDDFSAPGVKAGKFSAKQMQKLNDPVSGQNVKMLMLKDAAAKKTVKLNDPQILPPKNQKTTAADKSKVPVNKIKLANSPKLMLKNTAPPKSKFAATEKSNKLNPPIDFK